MSSDLSEDQPLLAKAATGSSAGALLRELRSKQGLHIGAMAAMLKVPQAKLEALEADRWQDLPDVTFARALAKAMCGVLKVDATAVLALLPRGNESELMVSRGLNQAYREHDGRAEGLSLAVLQRPLVWGSLLLLLAAAAVYLMPAGWVERLSQPQPATPEVIISTPQANPPALEPTLIEPAPAASAVALEVLPVPLANTAPAPMPAASASASLSTPALAAVPAPAGAVPLVVKISAESWVEVVDARGQVLLSRTLRTGEEQSLTGLPPLKVKVGNVAGTEMLLRGSKVDLAGQSQNNVARLELN